MTKGIIVDVKGSELRSIYKKMMVKPLQYRDYYQSIMDLRRNTSIEYTNNEIHRDRYDKEYNYWGFLYDHIKEDEIYQVSSDELRELTL